MGWTEPVQNWGKFDCKLVFYSETLILKIYDYYVKPQSNKRSKNANLKTACQKNPPTPFNVSCKRFTKPETCLSYRLTFPLISIDSSLEKSNPPSDRAFAARSLSTLSNSHTHVLSLTSSIPEVQKFHVYVNDEPRWRWWRLQADIFLYGNLTDGRVLRRFRRVGSKMKNVKKKKEKRFKSALIN